MDAIKEHVARVVGNLYADAIHNRAMGRIGMAADEEAGAKLIGTMRGYIDELEAASAELRRITNKAIKAMEVTR